MEKQWIIILYSCNKKFPQIWNILYSDTELKNFVSNANITQISESIVYNDDSDVSVSECSVSDNKSEYSEENTSNCILNLNTSYNIYDIPETSYTYFTNKTNSYSFLYHFDNTNKYSCCKPQIIAIDKREFEIYEIMSNLQIIS